MTVNTVRFLLTRLNRKLRRQQPLCHNCRVNVALHRCNHKPRPSDLWPFRVSIPGTRKPKITVWTHWKELCGEPLCQECIEPPAPYWHEDATYGVDHYKAFRSENVLEYYEKTTGRHLGLTIRKSKACLVYKQRDGQWITEREATPGDIYQIIAFYRADPNGVVLDTFAPQR